MHNAQDYIWSMTLHTEVPAGNYYLLAVTDASGLLTESNEANNIMARPIAIESPPPDLVVSAAGNQHVSRSGVSINTSMTVTNQGQGTAVGEEFPGWADDVYFSADDQLDEGDQILTSNAPQAHELAPGGSYDVNQTVLLPDAAEGGYYLIFKTDTGGHVSETDEENNTSVQQITIDNTPPVISNVELTPTCSGLIATWSTGEPSETFLHYWDDGSWKYFWNDWIFSTSHAATVDQLEPGTTYNFQIGRAHV